jgi:3-methylfumaryl-CoA hydratase
MQPPDVEVLRRWIGRSETASELIADGPARLLAATLDRHDVPQWGDPLPPAWHWLYFLPQTPTRDIGNDGMPQRGGFMPPVTLPRRMWAGSRIEMHHQIRLGDQVRQKTTITDVTSKVGASGPLVFVRVTTELHSEQGHALTEHRDVAFSDHPRRSDQPPSAGRKPTPHAKWREERRLGAVVLFRYSALTFNSHRIHYDQPYATQVEGFPGLVIPGPLLATLLAQSITSHVSAADIRVVAFRARGPVFAEEVFEIAGSVDTKSVSAWALSDRGIAMTADAELR